jgi:hypothetical protein
VQPLLDGALQAHDTRSAGAPRSRAAVTVPAGVQAPDPEPVAVRLAGALAEVVLAISRPARLDRSLPRRPTDRAITAVGRDLFSALTRPTAATQDISDAIADRPQARPHHAVVVAKRCEDLVEL